MQDSFIQSLADPAVNTVICSLAMPDSIKGLHTCEAAVNADRDAGSDSRPIPDPDSSPDPDDVLAPTLYLAAIASPASGVTGPGPSASRLFAAPCSWHCQWSDVAGLAGC
jgi:hypothetical protein